MKTELALIEVHLKNHGLLMVMDNDFPSYVTLITGESVQGSWWGHPKGNAIYNSLNVFLDRPDILSVKILNKKLTLVHQAHWSALLAVGLAKAVWQTAKLTPAHLDLLKTIDSHGKIRTDEIKTSLSLTEIGKLASKLEERLLIYSESVHTDSGKHARVLYSWPQLMKDRVFTAESLSEDEAQLYFELVRETVGSDYRPAFPWE